MVKSLRENKAEEFRTKYRNVSLFLVDDIQFIAGKQGTQEEFSTPSTTSMRPATR